MKRSKRRRWPRGAVLVLAVAAFVPNLLQASGAAAPKSQTVGIFGDSISAGEGLPDIQPGEDSCQRALGRDGRSTAWGVQVAARLSGGTSWFAACTGAQTEHFVLEAQSANGRDKTQFKEASTGSGQPAFDVILATFGINDVASEERLIGFTPGMSALVANCIGADEIVAGAATGAVTGLQGALIGGWIGAASARCRPGLDASTRLHIDSKVRGELRALYEAMYAATTANGLIVLPGYPQMFTHPDRWPSFNKATQRCQFMHRDDAHVIRGLFARLNEVILQEVERAKRNHPDRRWVYVDVVSTFDDHGLCSPNGQQWINGLVIKQRHERSYHPTQDGHDAYADAVSANVEVKTWFGGDGSGGSVGTSGRTNTSGSASLPARVARSVQSSTSIVIDVSSSMTEDAEGEPRIDVAQRAASDVLTLLASSPGIETTTGLFQFSTNAQEVAPLGSSSSTLMSSVAGLVPEGSTNLGAGLELGINQVSAAPGEKAVVLLSDGATNEGMTREQVLATLVPKASAAGVKVYTVGFGASGEDFDEDLLRQIAEGTGGDYGAAQALGGLRKLFQQAHYNSIGTVIANLDGAVSQGEVLEAGSFVVEPLKQQLHVALSWPGSDLDPVLIDPNGKTVNDRYEGVEFFRDQNPEVVVVDRPTEGEWTLKVKGKDVSESKEEFFAIAATQGQLEPEPASASVLVPLLLGLGALTLGGVGGGYAVVRTRRRPSGSCSRCGAPHDGRRPCANCQGVAMVSLDLMVLDGPQAGQVFRLQAGDVLGRGGMATHVLQDDSVSRNHAEIGWADGEWAIYDLGSNSGTYRNREPVSRAHLTVGDVITLGTTSLRVEETTAVSDPE